MDQPKDEGPWSTGLWNCFSDMRSSCGANATLFYLISAFTGCGFWYSCYYRSKLRRQYMLKESPCWDCCVHFFCLHCALCQEYRELKNRGFDVSVGWHGNIHMQNQGVVMAPVVEGAMKR